MDHSFNFMGSFSESSLRNHLNCLPEAEKSFLDILETEQKLKIPTLARPYMETRVFH